MSKAIQQEQELLQLLLMRNTEHRADIEPAILGAIILEDKYILVADILNPATFRNEDYRHIYATIRKMFLSAKRIDCITLSIELRQTQPEGERIYSYMVSELTNKVSSSANLEYHAMLLLQMDIWDKMVRLMAELMQDCGAEDSVARGVYIEALHLLDGDVFAPGVVDTMLEYATQHPLPEEHLKKLKEFEGNINKKMEAIGKWNHIDYLLKMMRRMGELKGHYPELCMEKITGIAAAIMSNYNVDHRLYSLLVEADNVMRKSQHENVKKEILTPTTESIVFNEPD